MSAQEHSSNDAGTQMLGSALAKVALVCFLLFMFVVGAWIAGTAYHDPDTCWLLGLGRYIFTHRALPTTDPFSFTFASGAAKPFVMYQWLTELVFYLCVHVGGLISLLSMVALLFYFAFFCIPMISFEKLGVSRLRTFSLVTLAFASASFHTLVRPEVVSYLLLSCWLAMMIDMRLSDEKLGPGASVSSADNAEPGASCTTQEKGGQGASLSPRIEWRLVGGFCLLIMIWCNMHTGFTIPLVILSLYVIVDSLQWLFSKDRGSYPYATAVCALVAVLLSTLINPNGLALWQYIPALFFSPINRFIVELRPFSGSFSDITYYPFIVLSIIAVADCINMLSKSSRKPRASWFSPVLIGVLIFLAFYCRRLIPFHAIALIFECAWMRAHRDVPSNNGVIEYANQKLKQMFSPNLAWVAVTAGIVILGAIAVATGKETRPHVPQSGAAFQDPKEVIDYLKQHPPAGHGFNWPEFGDVMIWQMDPVPQIFIDTRYDMYGAAIVNQCIGIATCKPGWRELLDQYKIDWVFVGPKLPLARQLSADPGWTKVVDSAAAVYFTRKPSVRVDLIPNPAPVSTKL